MTITTYYSSYPTANSLPKRRESRCSLFKVLKTAAFALLMLPAAATKDICLKPNTQYLCQGNMGIPRNQMPQVEGDVRNHYLAVKSGDTRISLEKIPAHKLTPVQGEISRDIVLSLVKAHNAGTFFPCEREILVARNETHDNIVDGHHTATACRLLGGSQLAIVISDFANKVFTELRRFPGVAKVNLDDSVLK